VAESRIVVLIDDDVPLPGEQAERICRLSSRIQLLHGITKDNLRSAHVIYTAQAAFDPADALCLRWVQTPSVAVNHLQSAPIANSGIPIANVRGAYAIAVAECALGLMLTLMRRLHICRSMELQGQWPPDKSVVQGENCYGKTIGIIGYGSTGRHIARLTQALGMKVMACKRRVEIKPEGVVFGFPNVGDPEGRIPEAWFGPEQLDQMLKRIDVAVVTLPLTNATRGLIGRRELEALPSHAYLLNVGRGGVVDEPALIDALQAGRFAGAGLDVFASEPLPADSLLWKLSNVVILPHIASYTKDQVYLAAEVLIENLRRFLSKQSLVNLVDMTTGY
jgi:phosphoglycerate dehydrogenase-like enzyme